MNAIVVLIGEMFVLLVLNLMGVTHVPDGVAFIFIAVFSLSYMVAVSSNPSLAAVRSALMAGYAWRVALLVWDLYGRTIYGLPNSGADSEKFYWTAYRIANGFGSAGFDFSQFCGTVMSCIGTSRPAMQFILLLFSVVALHAFVGILDELRVEDGIKHRFTWVMALLPNFAILSSVFLRESIVCMFASLSLLCFVRWFNGKSFLNFLLAFVFVFCGSAFHCGIVAMALAYAVIMLTYDRRRRVFHLKFKNLFPAFLFFFLFSFAFVHYQDVFFGKVQGIGHIEQICDGVGQGGGSDYAQYVGDSSNPVSMVVFTPLRMAFFLFSPLPWQWRGPADVIAFCFSSCFYVWSFYYAVKYVRHHRDGRKVLLQALLFIALSTLFIFGWGTTNTGTAARHRDKVVILYGVMLALGWPQGTTRRPVTIGPATPHRPSEPSHD